jgi:hypothetical protein
MSFGHQSRLQYQTEPVWLTGSDGLPKALTDPKARRDCTDEA